MVECGTALPRGKFAAAVVVKVAAFLQFWACAEAAPAWLPIFAAYAARA